MIASSSRRHHRSVRLALLLAAALILPAAAHATTVLHQPVEALTQGATLVVRGTVGLSQTRAESSGPVTRTLVKVRQVLKGPLIKRVQIWQQGGSAAGQTVSIAGSARFSPGEEVVLFLEPHPAEAGSYILTSMAAAKFALRPAVGGTVAVRDLGELSFVRPPSSGPAESVAPPAAQLPLPELLARIRTATGR